MNFFRRFTRPPNAILIGFDHVEENDIESIEKKIDEIRAYYDFTTVSQIGLALQKKKPLGYAGIVFTSARKSLFLKLVPFLRALKAPITFYLHPDYVGTNRLPPIEEYAILQNEYPNQGLNFSHEELKKTYWSSPDSIENAIDNIRKNVGPLPLNSLDPLRFQTTWGKILEIPPELREIGLNITSYPQLNVDKLTESARFIHMRAQKNISSVLSHSSDFSTESLSQIGVPYRVTADLFGPITKDSSPFHLSFFTE